MASEPDPSPVARSFSTSRANRVRFADRDSGEGIGDRLGVEPPANRRGGVDTSEGNRRGTDGGEATPCEALIGLLSDGGEAMLDEALSERGGGDRSNGGLRPANVGRHRNGAAAMLSAGSIEPEPQDGADDAKVEAMDSRPAASFFGRPRPRPVVLPRPVVPPRPVRA